MNRKFAVGALTGALLLSGLLVRVSSGQGLLRWERGGHYGGTEGATETVIELKWNTNTAEAKIEYFPMDTSAGRCTDSDPICLQVTLKDMPIFDQDGTRVGRQHIQCTVGWHLKPARSIDWFCSYVTQLKDGPYTDHGQLTGVGIKRPNGDLNISITGGTGAYEGAAGYIFQSGDTGKVTYTIHLAP